MDVIELRKRAIKRYINGESPKEIYQSLGKGKTWFFKWLKRYRLDGKDWSKSQSRKPQKHPKRIDEVMERLVLETRQFLEKKLYAQIGALAIIYHLQKEGIVPPPVSTVNKILKRNNRIHKRHRYVPKGANYPQLNITKSNHLHQLDVIGPRYLKEDGRFYSVNIIDAYDRKNSLNPDRRQNRQAICKALIACWHTLGIPCYLQMDNQLSLRGSNQFPHAFGAVIRLCLYMGVQPLFIPIREPWRNGIIEHFQNVFDKLFFRSQHFKDFDSLCRKAKEFEQFHNRYHHYSTLKGLTPNEKYSGNGKRLPGSFQFPDRLVISPGYIHLIRFIRSDGMLDVFGEKFTLPDELEYEYVWVTIDTSREKLLVYHDSQCVMKYSYPLPKSSILLSKFNF